MLHWEGLHRLLSAARQFSRWMTEGAGAAARPISPAGAESELNSFDGADLDIHAKLCRGRWPRRSSCMVSFEWGGGFLRCSWTSAESARDGSHRSLMICYWLLASLGLFYSSLGIFEESPGWIAPMGRSPSPSERSLAVHSLDDRRCRSRGATYLSRWSRVRLK